jgi:predicted RecA/RadA family phage recombinase
MRRARRQRRQVASTGTTASHHADVERLAGAIAQSPWLMMNPGVEVSVGSAVSVGVEVAVAVATVPAGMPVGVAMATVPAPTPMRSSPPSARAGTVDALAQKIRAIAVAATVSLAMILPPLVCPTDRAFSWTSAPVVDKRRENLDR